ncbi:hypothetical protein EVG20_g2820 [Dentipellis fragilis]|uniref:Uncharacterized protein n=1 Tax=Dentipellis fragilis TaxID=205917 RepID=A0A4Y9Z610_9AGAM|nr:hypothetical protein EVG20_g2820 [Dentipellis fragilis]
MVDDSVPFFIANIHLDPQPPSYRRIIRVTWQATTPLIPDASEPSSVASCHYKLTMLAQHSGSPVPLKNHSNSSPLGILTSDAETQERVFFQWRLDEKDGRGGPSAFKDFEEYFISEPTVDYLLNLLMKALGCWERLLQDDNITERTRGILEEKHTDLKNIYKELLTDTSQGDQQAEGPGED